MDIEIPSPSVFLRSPVQRSQPVPPPKKKAAAPKATKKQKVVDKDAASGAITKPKQSKSRNGCMTCKKKRLKCDETKPSCMQCQKRNVTCEGYKKDFKWRTFEETTFNNKVAPKRKSSATSENAAKRPKIPYSSSWPLESAFESASRAFQDTTPPNIATPSVVPNLHPLPGVDARWSPQKFDVPSPGSTFDLGTDPGQRDTTSLASSFSGSPTLLDLLLPGTDMNQPPDLSEERPPMSPIPYQPGPFVNSLPTDEQVDGEVDEEIVRDCTPWMRSSPTPSEGSSVSSKSSELTLMSHVRLNQFSPEMLLLHFDQHTCGILSVKDGPNENPWRSLIWPLAHKSPALYHAISSMTAFHGKHSNPHLRIAGVAHMHKSIKRLANDMDTTPTEINLATCLALALGEGWDEKASTGVQHLRGARVMVNNALVLHRQKSQLGRATQQDVLRLQFLCNTFIYLDVIARLTSAEEAEGLGLEDILIAANPASEIEEVDPLMGCASTLFPLIGRVATLIQKVRKTEQNTLQIITQANVLQQELLQWQMPDSTRFMRPEDPTSEIEHSLKTAEAYRVATLLYLQQAVPEISSDPHEAMARRVLVLLASVPLSSRTIIVQIYPLFAAGCEVVSEEERAWVTERWAAMIARLKINNMDSCWSVVQEVWNRRDEHRTLKAQRQTRLPSLPRRSTMTDIPLDQIEPEYTVRGRLHWLGVMSDWQWEVFLG